VTSYLPLSAMNPAAAFLAEAQGLSWALRKFVVAIHPTPRFWIEGGTLHCETTCIGAKAVREVLSAGMSTFVEPNLGHQYSVRAWWDGAAFVAERQCDGVNGGRPTVQRRWLDSSSGELIISQDWGGKRGPFVARFARRGSS
jgi:hypothetical protein